MTNERRHSDQLELGHGELESIAVAPSPAARNLLFASRTLQPAAYALRRAEWLANQTGSLLNLLLTLPVRSRMTQALSQLETELAAREINEFLDAARAASQWCQQVLGERFDDERLELSVSGLVETVCSRADMLDAALIIVPAGELRGTTVTRIVRATRRPVLVVRPQHEGRAVIAATDLSNQRFPVLHQARIVAEQLEAAVVLLHNIAPSRMLQRASTAWSNRKQHRTRDAGLAVALSSAAHEWSVPTAVITRSRDPVQAIMTEAQARDADLVVVGTHARSWMARVVRKSVAAQLVNRAQRSVLVAPIDRK